VLAAALGDCVGLVNLIGALAPQLRRNFRNYRLDGVVGPIVRVEAGFSDVMAAYAGPAHLRAWAWLVVIVQHAPTHPATPQPRVPVGRPISLGRSAGKGSHPPVARLWGKNRRQAPGARMVVTG